MTSTLALGPSWLQPEYILERFGTWAFVTQVLEMEFYVDWLVIAGVIVAAVVLTIAVGVATTWSALSVKPARFLREE